MGASNKLMHLRIAIQCDPAVLATDPPYFDNIGYAVLSDFFYVWLRRSLRDVWPDAFRRLLTPKSEELVATSHRHGGKENAERHFMEGMSSALRAMQSAASLEVPTTVYYAFKQSEISAEGLTSAGWATFLQAVADAGFVIGADLAYAYRTIVQNCCVMARMRLRRQFCGRVLLVSVQERLSDSARPRPLRVDKPRSGR